MVIFPTLLRKWLMDAERAVGASQTPPSLLSDHPKPGHFLQHLIGGRKGRREGGRKKANLSWVLNLYLLLGNTSFLLRIFPSSWTWVGISQFVQRANSAPMPGWQS